MTKKYHVNLTSGEREQLQGLLHKGKLSVRKVKRAQILLAADSGKIDEDIAQMLQVHINTVERVRKRFVEGGVDQALSEGNRPGGKSKLDGKGEGKFEGKRWARGEGKEEGKGEGKAEGKFEGKD